MKITVSSLATVKLLTNQQGAMLIILLIAVVVIGLASAMTGTTWSTMAQRDKEEQLLWVGQQYVRAIQSYYETGHAGIAPSFPRNLDELLRDPRAAQVVRHLRKIYKDPMTGDDLVIINDPAGRVRGVRSKSTLKPFRAEHFPTGLEKLASADSYSRWEFVFEPTSAQQDTQKTPSGVRGTFPGGAGIAPPSIEPLTGRPMPPIRRCFDPTPCPPEAKGDCIFDPDKCAFVPYVPSWKRGAE